MKKLFNKLDYLIYFDNILMKKFYSYMLIGFSIGLVGYLVSFQRQTKIIDNQKLMIYSLENDTTNLSRLLNDYSIDIEAYNNIINDKDYIRYIAFKHSDIIIPTNVPTEDLKIINRYSKKYQIPQKYIWRLIHTESRFKPNAKSHKGASGYMQIMPSTYNSLKSKYLKENGNKSLNNYNSNQINLILGIYYLRILHNKYNDWKLVFAAYNAGPGNVDNSKGIPDYEETKKYVKFIDKK